MSKITREEEALKRMYESLLGKNHYGMYSSSSIPIEKDYKEVLTKLQAQASKIERLKRYENMEYHLLNKSDNTVTMPKEQYHKFELELINKWYEECARETITKGKAIGYETELVKFINQQPQLSDDVEETLEEMDWLYEQDFEIIGWHLNGDTEHLNGFLDNFYNTIKQHIQTQASEIEELQQDWEVAMDNFKQINDKLNAIRELDNKLSKTEWTSRQSRALRYEKEVKQLLKEEK